MKRTLTFLAVVAGLAASTADARQMRRPAPLSPMTDEEVAKTSLETFARVDRNRDGSLSRLELTSWGYSNGWGVALRQKAWKQLDADRNGKVSEPEFRAYARRRTPRP